MSLPLDWNKLRVFHAAAEAGSFTHAAQRLHLSQSAISRQVSALEQDVRVPLFQRHARGLILTEQGEILYRTAHDILMKLENTRLQLSESREKPTGHLRVTSTFGMGTGWLAEHIPEFLNLYPDMQIQLLLDDEELDLTMRYADCAIRLRQPQQPDLIQRKLFTVHMHVYASENYIANYGKPEKLSELDEHRIISFGEPVPPYLVGLNWLQRAGKSDDSVRVSILQINNIVSIKNALMRDLGIAVLPDYIVNNDEKLIRLFPDMIDIPSFDTFFCYSAALKNSAKLNVFRDYIFLKARKWSF
ncbi:DNA-binding transcriptional regulator, LysR family [Bartonella sp. CDC_skunk]|uniref:Transcriptional regulator, LysR family n=1 Tax=Bartonella rochalimae ATCC BAA-1498 TaxID=685782 RepID=E6YKP0_9HYPH|nr:MULTISPECIES: LysR family transcriptional regulator [Bartonella]AQX18725.1 DNA-binding transcriptional regulator, LysR family [Bartonella sp. A1379B]AQX21729.1 DNA-binding transcriptional regulator, LysR family [Bartonella sp. CDC_skunk]AQX23237.1 DNA-binding transcriptional regulator, LysR family [Bartonella sp. 11B]AQX23460.1 DNA-binding transcriptional regulator, LysR family [Bartonella sp. 114]AQX25695.1 DNA-binding transcriptional regulator, LysR family [Bartonella sp. Coyote22sub2]